MMKINFTKDVCKLLETLPAKQYRQIDTKLESLMLDPRPADYKHVRYHPGVYRVDCGEYRICYRILEDIEVIVLDKRNDDRVYRKLNRVT